MIKPALSDTNAKKIQQNTNKSHKKLVKRDMVANLKKKMKKL